MKKKKHQSVNILTRAAGFVLAALVLIVGGWWLYDNGYFSGEPEEEVGIYEVEVTDSAESQAKGVFTGKTWEFESSNDIRKYKGRKIGWVPLGPRLLKINKGIMSGYLTADSYFSSPDFVVNKLNDSNAGLKKDFQAVVTAGSVSVKMTLKNLLVEEGSAVLSYPDVTQKLDWMFDPGVDQVYKKITGKLIVRGYQREVSLTGKTTWKLAVLKEVSASAENVKTDEYFELNFDLGSFNSRDQRVTSVQWYPVIAVEAPEGSRVLPVSFKAAYYNRKFNYDFALDWMKFLYQKTVIDLVKPQTN